MTKPVRTPIKLPAKVVVPFIALSLALLVWALSFAFPFAVMGQVYAVILILLGFRYWPPMIRLVKSMPVPHRVVFGLLLGSMILGHLTFRPRTWFPYEAWAIFPFVHEVDPVTCHEFIATTASGKKVRLLVEQLFPSIVQIDPLDNDPPAATDHLARALARAYNQHHAADPVRQVDLMVMAVKLHPSATESYAEPSCELLKHCDISSGPSN